MKTIFKFALHALFAVGFSSSLSGQGWDDPSWTNFITWDFETSAAGVVSPGVPAIPSVFSFLNGTGGTIKSPGIETNGGSDPDGGAFYGSGWSTASSWENVAVDDAHFTFFIQNQCYYDMFVQNLKFRFSTETGGPDRFYVAFSLIESVTDKNDFIVEGLSTDDEIRFENGLYEMPLYAGEILAWGYVPNKKVYIHIYPYHATDPDVELAIDNIEINGVDDFYFHASCGCYQCETTLPVRLTTFESETENGTIQLTWNTESEQLSAYFDVERSTDGREFTRIGTVQAAGVSDSRRTYHFRDLNPGEAITYYRLKQVDLDGSFEYSGIISVSAPNTPESGLIVLGNPVSAGKIKVLVSADYVSANMELVDLHGRKAKVAISSATGNELVIESLHALTPGVYILRSEGLPPVRLLVN